ncbi:MAG: NAD(P)H-dependent oxidoreductase [Acidimicrobiales bacterium]
MHALVVHAHPVPGSYSHALRDAVVSGLRTAGHDVELIDLYEIDYRPWMTDDEHRHYESIAEAHPDPVVARHIELVRWADALVLVYPTWWSGLPAILKGWLDRTMLPGVAFRLDERTNKVKGVLELRHLIGVTTYGSPSWYMLFVGDAGRRTITRTIRLVCGRSTKTHFHRLHKINTIDDAARQAYLREVEASFASLDPAASASPESSKP